MSCPHNSKGISGAGQVMGIGGATSEIRANQMASVAQLPHRRKRPASHGDRVREQSRAFDRGVL